MQGTLVSLPAALEGQRQVGTGPDTWTLTVVIDLGEDKAERIEQPSWPWPEETHFAFLLWGCRWDSQVEVAHGFFRTDYLLLVMEPTLQASANPEGSPPVLECTAFLPGPCRPDVVCRSSSGQNCLRGPLLVEFLTPLPPVAQEWWGPWVDLLLTAAGCGKGGRTVGPRHHQYSSPTFANPANQ